MIVRHCLLNIIFEDFEELKKQEMEFMNFVYNKAIEYTNKYYDHFEQVILLKLGSYTLEIGSWLPSYGSYIGKYRA